MSNASSSTSPGEPRQPQVSQAQRTAEAKAAVIESLKAVSANIDSEMQARARTIHSMDESLTTQDKSLRKDTKQLGKDNDNLQKFIDKSKKQLAAYDDLDALHATLDADLEDLEEMLRMIEDESGDEIHDAPLETAK